MLIVIGLLCVLLLEGVNCAKVSPICPTGTPAVNARGQYTYCAASADAPSSCPGDDEGLSYCSGIGLCCCNDSSATCPNCVVPLNCSSDVCEAKTCPNHPKALCVINYCGSCEPRFFVGKEEVTASCLEPPQCKGKMYGGHCLDDDCVLMEVNGQLTDRCRQMGGECLVDLNNNVRCFTDVPRKKPPKKDDDDDEDEDDDEEEEDDCYPLPYCPPDVPTKRPRPVPPDDDDDDDDDTVSTVTTATGTTTTGTGTMTTGTGTTGTGTMTTGTGTTGTGTMTTDTASTGTASTATTNDDTASTATTDTGTTDTQSTGTASTATTNDGTASTATTKDTGSKASKKSSKKCGSSNDDDDGSSKASKKSSKKCGDDDASSKASKKGSKGKRHLRSTRKDDDYERNVSEDKPHYYRRYQRYYYDN